MTLEWRFFGKRRLGASHGEGNLLPSSLFLLKLGLLTKFLIFKIESPGKFGVMGFLKPFEAFNHLNRTFLFVVSRRINIWIRKSLIIKRFQVARAHRPIEWTPLTKIHLLNHVSLYIFRYVFSKAISHIIFIFAIFIHFLSFCPCYTRRKSAELFLTIFE